MIKPVSEGIMGRAKEKIKIQWKIKPWIGSHDWYKPRDLSLCIRDSQDREKHSDGASN